MVNKFSVVLATYTGEEHIQDCLDSILDQTAGNYTYETIVIIDGPNKTLRQKVNKTAKKFVTKKLPFKVHQFTKNQGRFAARLKGAELAKHPQLLFVDDRSILDKDYFNNAIKSGEEVIIANAVEATSPTIISRILYLVRRRLYRGKWGEDFNSFYITAENFEKSSKGTAGFWVPKRSFLKACGEISGQDLKSTNEDTKLFKSILASGRKLYKSSKAKISYRPRTELKEELKHLYGRGPRFIDYYFQPGTRFYLHIWLALILGIVSIIILIATPLLAKALGLAFLVVLGLTAFFLSETPADIIKVAIGLPLILVAFAAGIAKGLWGKLKAHLGA